MNITLLPASAQLLATDGTFSGSIALEVSGAMKYTGISHEFTSNTIVYNLNATNNITASNINTKAFSIKKNGGNSVAGTVTLVDGTGVVTTNKYNYYSSVFFSVKTMNSGSTTPHLPCVSSTTGGTFTVKTVPGDYNTYNWLIVDVLP
jgi:hypothetical protein